jgi:uncharacterized protein
VSADPPLPVVDDLTRPFWDGAREGRLVITRCQACGFYIHHPRPVCRFCGSLDVSPEVVSGRGRLYTWTVAVQPFHPWYASRVPYVLATVELAEQPGLMMLTNVVECDEGDLHPGMPLQVTFRSLSDDIALPVVRPAATGTGTGTA